jgi:hypothetical protein
MSRIAIGKIDGMALIEVSGQDECGSLIKARRIFRLLFLIFEPLVIGAAFVMLKVDWRNPATRAYDDAVGILFFGSLLIVAISSFGLRRTDPRWTRIGMLTVFGIFILGILTPAL